MLSTLPIEPTRALRDVIAVQKYNGLPGFLWVPVLLIIFR